MLGYEKSVQDNISDKVLQALQDAAAELLAQDDSMTAQAVAAGELLEIAL